MIRLMVDIYKYHMTHRVLVPSIVIIISFTWLGASSQTTSATVW